MIGYKNVTHQGWKMQKLRRSQDRVTNPYPPQSEAHHEFNTGASRYLNGQDYEGNFVN